MRRAVAKALGELRDARAVRPFLAALTDEDASVQSAAAKALGEIQDPETLYALCAKLSFGPRSAEVIGSVLAALEALRCPGGQVAAALEAAVGRGWTIEGHGYSSHRRTSEHATKALLVRVQSLAQAEWMSRDDQARLLAVASGLKGAHTDHYDDQPSDCCAGHTDKTAIELA